MKYKKYNSLGDYILEKCREGNQNVFLKEKKTSQEYTYSAFLQEINRASTFLRGLGIQSGDQVILEMGNSPAALAVFFGAIMINSVPIIISPRIKSDDLRYILDNSEAAAYFSESARNDVEIPTYDFRCYRSTQQEDCPLSWPTSSVETAYMTFTTGSTGQPKKVCVSHNNMLAEIHSMADAYNFTQQDRHLCVLPLYHASGLYRSILLPFHVGGYVIQADDFQCDIFWEDIDSEKISFVQVVPSILKTLLMCTYNYSEGQARTLKYIGSASAPHPVKLIQSFEDRFGVYVLQGYGMTEATCGITLNPLSKNERKYGSVGKPLSVNSIDIIADNDEKLPQGEIGRIIIYGDNIASVSEAGLMTDHTTVLETTDKTLETGDIGYIDMEGFLWIVSRKQDFIKRGGHRISPNEIENIIIELFPDFDVAVLGVPHELLGQDIIAVIANNRDRLTSRDILRSLKNRISSYKIPSHIMFVDSLPRLGVGKTDKKHLLHLYQTHTVKSKEDRFIQDPVN